MALSMAVMLSEVPESKRGNKKCLWLKKKTNNILLDTIMQSSFETSSSQINIFLMFLAEMLLMGTQN